MKHLTSEQLSRLRDGSLEGGARREAESHLETCPSCRESLADMAELDDRLASALEHDPGDAYFEAFAGRVQQRLGSEVRRAVAPAGWWRSLTTPRGLAWAGGVAALIIVAGIITMQSRETPLPMSRPEIAARTGQQAPAPSEAPPTGGAAPQAANEAYRSEPAPAAPSSEAPRSDAGRQDRDDGSLRAPSDEKRETHRTTRSKEGPPAPGSPTVDAMRAPQQAQEQAPSDRAQSLGASPAPSSASARDVAPQRETAMAQRAAKRNAAGEEVAADRGAPALAREGSQKPPAPASLLGAVKQRAAAPLEKTALDDRSRAGASGFAAAPSGGKLFGATESNARFTWPRALLAVADRAEHLDRLAVTRRSATACDSVAAEWTRIAGRAEPGSVADREARARAADARLAALRFGSTPGRRLAAIVAIERVLEIAPPGPRRDAFQMRLEELLRD
jgi:anti-sigma factor RsiW